MQIRRHALDAEAVPLTPLLEQREIPAPLVTEAEVIADHQMAHAQPFEQQPADEVHRLHGGEPAIKAQHYDAIHTLCLQLDELLAQAAQARRGIRAQKELLRRRLEGDHGGRQAQYRGLLTQLVQHLLMAQVHAIIVADGRHAAAMMRA